MLKPIYPVHVIGSSNADLVLQVDRMPKLGETVLGNSFSIVSGGKGANQAVAAAKAGGKVRFASSIGADAFGDLLISSLAQQEVNCDLVSTCEGMPTGVATVQVNREGDNQIVVVPGANMALSPDQVDKALRNTPAGTVVLLQLEVPINVVAHAAHKAAGNGCFVILDPAPIPAEGVPNELFRGVSLVTPNRSETESITGVDPVDESSARQAAQVLLDLGAKNVIITLGAMGSVLVNESEFKLIEPCPVSAIDTTAAGDCFNGALAAEISRGCSLASSAQFAARAAEIAVSRLGAQSSLPTYEEIIFRVGDTECPTYGRG